MKLEQSLEGKRVKIVTTEAEIFIGEVVDYIFPEDNEPEGIAGVNLYNCPKSGEWTGLNEDEIESIDIIGEEN